MTGSDVSISSRRLIAARNTAITPSSTPTAIATNASNAGCGPNKYADAGDEQRQHDAEQRDGVLEQHGEHGGVVAVLANALPAADLLQRDANVHDSSASANSSRPITSGVNGAACLRIQQRVHAVVEVDAAADEEHADRRDERPEDISPGRGRTDARGRARWRPRTSPTLSSTWLPTSASEWTVSANSVGEPVTNQPKPLDTAIAVFVAIEIVTELDMRVYA